jgi:hypothetical protein
LGLTCGPCPGAPPDGPLDPEFVDPPCGGVPGLFTGANRTPEALRRNPYGGLPVLELDDGTCIAESVAICALPVVRDLMGDGIRVNTILPGIFDTPLLQRAPERVKAGLAASVPFPKRLGRPDEYAALAELMITNGYFNGERSPASRLAR